jgi:hypothetical protein
MNDSTREDTTAAGAGAAPVPAKERITTPYVALNCASMHCLTHLCRYLTKYERARLLGTRAMQLSMNAPSTVPIEVHPH